MFNYHQKDRYLPAKFFQTILCTLYAFMKKYLCLIVDTWNNHKQSTLHHLGADYPVYGLTEAECIEVQNTGKND